LRERFINNNLTIHQNVSKHFKTYKNQFDIKAEAGRYNVGDLVLYFNEQSDPKLFYKFRQNWLGPFRVIRKINSVVYEIQLCNTNKIVVAHFNYLKPYIPRDLNDLNVTNWRPRGRPIHNE